MWDKFCIRCHSIWRVIDHEYQIYTANLIQRAHAWADNYSSQLQLAITFVGHWFMFLQRREMFATQSW